MKSRPLAESYEFLDIGWMCYGYRPCGVIIIDESDALMVQLGLKICFRLSSAMLRMVLCPHSRLMQIASTPFFWITSLLQP